MSLSETLQDGRIQYVTLWTLAILCFGFGATNTAVLGLEQAQLFLLATVFAAVTAEYSGQDRCSETRAGS
jgi:hypothetical protein